MLTLEYYPSRTAELARVRTRIPVKARESRPAQIGNMALQVLFRPIAGGPLLAGSEPAHSQETQGHRPAGRMTSSSTPRILRKCDTCATGEPCAECEAKAHARASLAGHGQPLPLSLRTYFEPRLGHDFGDVRIHTDGAAAEAARAVRAHAYTTGHDVFFGAGQYSPYSLGGRTLLAHELTHVVQQRTARPPADHLSISEPDDPAEREADRVAEVIGKGRMAEPQSLTTHQIVARQGEGDLPLLAQGGTATTQPASSIVVCDFDDHEGFPLIMRGSQRHAVGYAQKKLNIEIDKVIDCLRSTACRTGLDDLALSFIEIQLTQLTEFPLVVDCKFGRNTEIATKIFQASMFRDSAEWDGKIGPKTWRPLEIGAGNQPPPAPVPPFMTPLPPVPGSPGPIFL